MLQRLQDSVLMRVRELSKQGAIEARWQEMQMLFHSPPANDAA